MTSLLTGSARLLVFAGVAALLLSCDGVEEPFNLTADNVDLEGPQLPARIQLSEAQVFSRESLLNDRNREVKFLQTQIDDDSVKTQFVPQLQRDLTNITTIAAQLGIGFNPAVGLQNEQTLERNEKLSEVETKRLDIELRRLQNDLDKLSRGEEVGEPEGVEKGTLTAPPSADTSKAIGQLKELTSQVLNLLGKDFRTAKTGQSPEQVYRDWQAYRAELRADEQAAKLDDIHDVNGNTLYRMQFTATILPGRETDKFGIAMVDVEPPSLDVTQLGRLYYQWLQYVNGRLNRVTENGIDPDRYYERIGQATSLFDTAVAEVYSEKSEGKKKPILLEIAVHPRVQIPVQAFACLSYLSDDEIGIKEITDQLAGTTPIEPSPYLKNVCLKTWRGIWEKIKESKTKSTNETEEEAGTGPAPTPYQGGPYTWQLTDVLSAMFGGDEAPESTPQTRPKDAEQKKELPGADVYCPARDSVEAAILAINRILETPGADVDPSNVKMLTYRSIVVFDDAFNKNCKDDQRKLPPPDQFLDTLRGKHPKTVDVFKLVGRSYAYAAMPVERAQRLSTVASAANAMQLALAMSAVLPGQGLNIDGSAAYQRMAVGTIDALERAPLVIGFADRAESSGEKVDSADGETESSDGKAESSGGEAGFKEGRFGWLFGPPLRVDTENNALVHRQVLANHRVLADISIPAWWPSVNLKVRSAWIGSWDDPDRAVAEAAALQSHPDRYMDVDENSRKTSCGKVFPNQFCQTVSVDLPQSSADLHALTNKLAEEHLQQPLRAPSIDRIVPPEISACADQVELLVYGVDLWRSPEANLRGVKATSETVLPDMAGLALTFDLSKLPPPAVPGQEDRLWIVTQNGPVGRAISITGDRAKKDQACGSKAKSELALAMASPPIVYMKPGSDKGTDLKFKVASGELPDSYSRIFVYMTTVDVDPTLQAPALKEGVALTAATDKALAYADLFGVDVSKDRKTLTVENVRFSGPIEKKHDGAPLVAGVRLSARPGMALKDAKEITKDQHLVLCTGAEICAVKLKTNVDKAPEGVKVATVKVASAKDAIPFALHLPAGFGWAFSGLGPETSKLRAYMEYKDADGNPGRVYFPAQTLKFSDDPKKEDWRKEGPEDLNVKLPAPGDDDQAAYAKEIGGNGAVLKFEWVTTEGALVPPISDLELTVKVEKTAAAGPAAAPKKAKVDVVPVPGRQATVPKKAEADPVRTIFLIRHADRDGPANKNVPLSDLGRKQAQKLKHVLADSQITKIYAADACRTIQTVYELAAKPNAEKITVFGKGGFPESTFKEHCSDVLTSGKLDKRDEMARVKLQAELSSNGRSGPKGNGGAAVLIADRSGHIREWLEVFAISKQSDEACWTKADPRKIGYGDIFKLDRTPSGNWKIDCTAMDFKVAAKSSD